MSAAAEENVWQIAIVGAGVAGATAAYFLRRDLGERVAITVFEKETAVGGRVGMRSFAGADIEVGATLIHSANEYLIGLMKTAGLDQIPPHDVQPGRPSTFGIWNGRSFDLTSSPHSWQNPLRLFWRYGFSLLRLQRLVQKTVNRWQQIYRQQEAGLAYPSPAAMLNALGIYELAHTVSYDYFHRRRIGDRLVRELVDGVSRNNYGQDGRINTLANMVSLAGGGLAGGHLFAVKGGNHLLCERGLELAAADLHRGTAVRAITPDPGDSRRYRLTLDDGGSASFDAVILAAPLELAQTEIMAPDLVPTPGGRRPFQTTHATFVAGTLTPDYFGLPHADRLPSMILTRESDAIPFSSIGVTGYSPQADTPIYKLFSRQPLADDVLNSIFSRRHDTLRMTWQAYPQLAPTAAWPPFQLAPRLYYVNGMETAVSTMETEVVASRNVVNLLRQEMGIRD